MIICSISKWKVELFKDNFKPFRCDVISISLYKSISSSIHFKKNLRFISANFDDKLHNRNVPLVESLNLFHDAIKLINGVKGKDDEKVSWNIKNINKKSRIRWDRKIWNELKIKKYW